MPEKNDHPTNQTNLYDMVKEWPDKFGNKIEVIETSSGVFNIKLTLRGDPRKRLLGIINEKSREFMVRRDRTKHLFKKAMAYGFNDSLLRNTKKFEKVILIEDTGTFEIPVSDILSKGFYLNFKQQGFEVQIFMSLDELKPYKINNHV